METPQSPTKSTIRIVRFIGHSTLRYDETRHDGHLSEDTMRKHFDFWLVIRSLLLTICFTTSAGYAQEGAPTNGEWPTYGGDLGGTKYSPLSQINRNNF